MTTKVIDKGYNQLRKQMKAADGLREQVGWFGAATHPGPRGSRSKRRPLVAEVALFNELGGPNRPPRPTLAPTADKNRRRYLNELGPKAADAMLAGKSAEQVLQRFGVGASSDVVLAIDALRSPPLAASTIRRKKSSKPLIDTGLMRAKVSHRTVGK